MHSLMLVISTQHIYYIYQIIWFNEQWRAHVPNLLELYPDEQYYLYRRNLHEFGCNHVHTKLEYWCLQTRFTLARKGLMEIFGLL